jgi:hypothetical protein
MTRQTNSDACRFPARAVSRDEPPSTHCCSCGRLVDNMRDHPPRRQSTWTAANRVVANALQIGQEETRQACCSLADEFGMAARSWSTSTTGGRGVAAPPRGHHHHNLHRHGTRPSSLVATQKASVAGRRAAREPRKAPAGLPPSELLDPQSRKPDPAKGAPDLMEDAGNKPPAALNSPWPPPEVRAEREEKRKEESPAVAVLAAARGCRQPAPAAARLQGWERGCPAAGWCGAARVAARATRGLAGMGKLSLCVEHYPFSSLQHRGE